MFQEARTLGELSSGEILIFKNPEAELRDFHCVNCLSVLRVFKPQVFFLKYFPNLNPMKSRGSKMKLEFDLMKLECQHHVNKDNFETQVSMQHYGLDG